MSDEKRALTRHSAPPSEADYEAILAAVMETGRGRWFLHEFAQRNRHAETRGVLTAIERIESLLRAQAGDTALPVHPAAKQIAAAIARAQDMLAASPDGDSAKVFDNVVQTLDSAQVRIRGVFTRLRDIALALREEGGHSRVCNDIDRQLRDLEMGCTHIEDVSGDIRILITLLKEIESLAEVPAAASETSATDTSRVPEALVVTPVAVPPQPQNDPVETGIMVSDTVSLDELEACAAEFEDNAPETTAASVSPADTVAETVVPGSPPSADAAGTELPAHRSIAPDALIQSEPADFLLEPLPRTEPQAPEPQSVDAAPPVNPKLTIVEKKPLQLESFDPLAPLRALSDEEKIALFS
jgi:chemotaxis protein CheZ